MHQLHILNYEFAQNELKVWYKSLLICLNLNLVFQILIRHQKISGLSASAFGSTFRTVQNTAAFSFAVAHQK
jgi:hypothetical protein